MKHRRRLIGLLAMGLLWLAAQPPVLAAGPPALFSITTFLTPAASGLGTVTDIQAPPDGSDRIFFAGKSGVIRVYDGGLPLPDPPVLTFLTFAENEIWAEGEGGLLGIAFHPDFGNPGNGNDYLFVSYTPEVSGQDYPNELRVVRYLVGNNGTDNVPTGGPTRIISISREGSTQGNHLAGQIQFGPDGYLYIATGDGGSGNDPFENGQDIESRLGKLLRIDVNSDGFPADANANYAIPAGNPFAGVAGQDEIWAVGLRNPWRFSFHGGQLFIADVGQGAQEEVNVVSATTAGLNYGWDCREGLLPHSDPSPGGACPGGYTDPVMTYGRSVGSSITGGYVYTGSELPQFENQYIFGDYGSGRIFAGYDTGAGWNFYQIGSSSGITTFGRDAQGEIYIGRVDGTVLRLTGTPPSHVIYLPLVRR